MQGENCSLINIYLLLMNLLRRPIPVQIVCKLLALFWYVWLPQLAILSMHTLERIYTYIIYVIYIIFISCSSKTQIGFTCLVPAHLGSPRQRAVKRVCYIIFIYLCYMLYLIPGSVFSNIFIFYGVQIHCNYDCLFKTENNTPAASKSDVRHVLLWMSWW